MNVVVNGLMTNYKKTGKGKTIVLLHGWADTAATFSELTQRLQDRYTILALDMPGFGGTQAPEQAWSQEDYARFIADWLKKIKAGEIYAIGGHSYGGSIAMTGLAGGKLKAKKLILLASAGIRNKKPLRRKAFWTAAKVGKLPLYLLPPSKRRRVRQKLYSAVGSDMTFLPHMELTFKRIIGEDMRLAAQKINTPTLLVYGSKDKDTPVSDSQKLNKLIKNSNQEVIDAGHFLHQEQPQQVAALIEDFLG